MLKCISINSLSTRQNIRENVVNDKEFAQLCDSIKANGLLSPLTVREIDDNEYEIITGHRRYEALKAIGEAMVECNVVDMFETENEIIRAQLSENVHRKNMTPFEYVKVFDKLKENYNMSNGQLALYLNKSLSWVNDQYAAVDILKNKYGDEEDIPEEIRKKAASTIKSYKQYGTKEEKVKKSGDGFHLEIKRHIYKITCTNNEFENELIKLLKKYNMN